MTYLWLPWTGKTPFRISFLRLAPWALRLVP